MINPEHVHQSHPQHTPQQLAGRLVGSAFSEQQAEGAFQVVNRMAPVIPLRPSRLVKCPDIHYPNDYPDDDQRARIWQSAKR